LLLLLLLVVSVDRWLHGEGRVVWCGSRMLELLLRHVLLHVEGVVGYHDERIRRASAALARQRWRK